MREFEPLRDWAERNGIPLRRAYQYAERQHLPILRIGRRVFIDLRALEALRQRQIERLVAKQERERAA